MPPTGRWMGWARRMLELETDTIGDEHLPQRADERAVLEDLDQQFERDLRGLADDVGGARQREVSEEQQSGHADRCPQEVCRGAGRAGCAPRSRVNPFVYPRPGIDDA